MRVLLPIMWLLLALVGLGGAADAQSKGARPAMRRQIQRAIERGAEALLASQGKNREWGGSTDSLDTSPTALAVYTLLQTGADRDSPKIKGAISLIRRAKHRRTYGIACALMALGAHDAREHRKRIQSLTDKLVRAQSSGTWGYPAGDDLSNTQFAVLGLWAAARAGADVPDKVWVRCAEALPLYANVTGGFAYHRGGGAPTGSMTAAGLGSLAICRAMLEKADGDSPIDEDLERRLDLIEAQGLEWLADNFSGSKNPPGNSWVAYYLYGTERVGALFDMSRFGTHDWYSEGALYFLVGQSDDGSWTGSGGSVATTCFALLFLRRATTKLVKVPVSGPTQARASDDLDRDDLERLDRRDLGRNRAQHARPRAEASSTAGKHGSNLACDGRLDTWWEARPSDETPELTIVFKAPREVDTVLVSHPRGAGKGLGRVLTYRVRINGRDTYDVSMPPATERKGRLELPTPVIINRIDITLTSLGPVSDGTRRAGIGEVEIQTRPAR